MINEEIKRDSLGKSIFEAGAKVSKSITLLMTISLTLVLAIYNENDKIKVPFTTIEIENYRAIIVLLFIYMVFYLNYVILLNKQKYLFNELSRYKPYSQDKTLPWESLNPTVYNTILYHSFKKSSSTKLHNIILIGLFSYSLGLFIPGFAIYCLYKEVGFNIVLFWIIPSLIIYAFSVIHSHEYLKSRTK